MFGYEDHLVRMLTFLTSTSSEFNQPYRRVLAPTVVSQLETCLLLIQMLLLSLVEVDLSLTLLAFLSMDEINCFNNFEFCSLLGVVTILVYV